MNLQKLQRDLGHIEERRPITQEDLDKLKSDYSYLQKFNWQNLALKDLASLSSHMCKDEEGRSLCINLVDNLLFDLTNHYDFEPNRDRFLRAAAKDWKRKGISFSQLRSAIQRGMDGKYGHFDRFSYGTVAFFASKPDPRRLQYA